LKAKEMDTTMLMCISVWLLKLLNKPLGLQYFSGTSPLKKIPATNTNTEQSREDKAVTLNASALTSEWILPTLE